MVLAVCRRVLRDFHLAEDAFQATFLVLASKATSVLKSESLGCWLHAVAYHTALAAADAHARRQARERQVQDMHDMPHPEAVPAASADWRPHLDRELNRLSDKYRTAIVLCDLEGLPQKEAGRILGVPARTVGSRVTRARALLAKRLSARGVSLASGALSTLLAADAAAAQVPLALAGSTARVAALVATGQLAAATGPAVVLMKGVMQAMLMKKLKLVAGALMVTAALGSFGLTWMPRDKRAAPSLNHGHARWVHLSGCARVASPSRSWRPCVRRMKTCATVRVLLKEIHFLEGAGEGSGVKPSAVKPGPVSPASKPGSSQRGKPSDADVKPDPLPGTYLHGATTFRGHTPGDPNVRPDGAWADHPGDPYQGESLDRGGRAGKLACRGSGRAGVAGALKLLREADDVDGRQRAEDALERAVRMLRTQVGQPTTGQKR